MTFRAVWRPQTASVVDRAGDDGLKKAGEALLERSLAVVPRLTESLANSAEVSVAKDEVIVSYASPYAVVQHENTSMRHETGKQAKYLEDPLDRYTAELRARIATALAKVMPRWRV